MRPVLLYLKIQAGGVPSQAPSRCFSVLFREIEAMAFGTLSALGGSLLWVRAKRLLNPGNQVSDSFCSRESLTIPSSLKAASSRVARETHTACRKSNTQALPSFSMLGRSEERRVGKECRSRWS